MRNLAIAAVVITLGVVPSLTAAQPHRGNFSGGGGSGNAQRGAASPQRGGGGFNLNNDVASRAPNGGNRSQGGAGQAGFNNDVASRAPNGGYGSQGGTNQGGFNLNRDVPSSPGRGTSTAYRPGYDNNTIGNRTGNTTVGNRNNNSNTNVNRNDINRNNINANRNVHVNQYGYHGAVIGNPVYHGPAWGWNHGAVWSPSSAYWGGGFWGTFAAGVATAVVMGTVVNAATNQTNTSYKVSQDSPGAQLLSNYGLQQVACGPPNLVVIYGPNNGVICANPNNTVAAGNYAVNMDDLTLQSP